MFINHIVKTTLQACQAALGPVTPHGLLVGVAEQIENTGLRPKLEALPLDMKEVRYRPADKALTVIASVAVGCEDNLEINIQLRPDLMAAELFGMPAGLHGEPPQFPEQSTVSDYQRATTAAYVQGLREIHHQVLAANRCAQPDPTLGLYVLDVDTTFHGVYGKTYEQADKGFSGRHRSTRGYRQGLATYADSKEAIEMTFLPARAHDLSHVQPLVEGIRRHHPDLSQVCWRGDAHFGSLDIQRDYQSQHLHYVCAGFDPGTAERLARTVPADAWIPVDSGSEIYDCGTIELSSSASRKAHLPPLRVRVLLDRRPKKNGLGYDYKHYVTDFPVQVLSAKALYEFYYGRENSESDMGERKNQLHVGNLRSRAFCGIHTFEWLALLTSNLLVWMQRRRLYDTPLETVGRHKLITEAMAIPARLTPLGRTWAVAWSDRHPWAAWLVQAFNRGLKLLTPPLGSQLSLPLSSMVALRGP